MLEGRKCHRARRPSRPHIETVFSPIGTASGIAWPEDAGRRVVVTALEIALGSSFSQTRLQIPHGKLQGHPSYPIVFKGCRKLVGRAALQFFLSCSCYGLNQFAYTKGRGCKDLLALNVVTWLWELFKGHRIGLHLSDVSGAFDRMSAERLLQKLRSAGLFQT